MTEQEIQLSNEGNSLPSVQFNQSGDSYHELEYISAAASECESKLLLCLEDTSMKNRLADETIVEELSEDCRDDMFEEDYNDDEDNDPAAITPSVDREEEGAELVKSYAYDDDVHSSPSKEVDNSIIDDEGVYHVDSTSTDEDHSSEVYDVDSPSTDDDSSILVCDEEVCSCGPSSELVSEKSVTNETSDITSSADNANLVTGIDLTVDDEPEHQASSQDDDDDQDNKLQEELLVQETQSISSDGDIDATNVVAGIDLNNAEEEAAAVVQLDNDDQDKLDEGLVQEAKSVSSEWGLRFEQGKSMLTDIVGTVSATMQKSRDKFHRVFVLEGCWDPRATFQLLLENYDAKEEDSDAVSEGGTTSGHASSFDETNSLVQTAGMLFSEDEEGNFIRFTNQAQKAKIPNKDTDPKSSLLRLATTSKRFWHRRP